MYILEVFDISNKNGIIFNIPLSTYFPLHMSVLRGSGAYELRMWALDRPPGCTSHLHHRPPISSRQSYQPFSWLSYFTSKTVKITGLPHSRKVMTELIHIKRLRVLRVWHTDLTNPL